MTEKPYNHGTMTESQYLAFIRSALRSKWLRWIPRSKALEAAKRPYKGDNKRQKVEYKCAICGGYGSSKEMEVDHYPKDAGSILRIEDIGEFCKNLFCEIENLRVVHKECHKVYTHSQRTKISFEEAFIEKKIIAMLKKENLQETLAILKENGYNDLSNDKKRRDALREYLKGEQND